MIVQLAIVFLLSSILIISLKVIPLTKLVNKNAETNAVVVEQKKAETVPLDPEQIKSIIKEEVKKIPKPVNGKDGISPEPLPALPALNGANGKSAYELWLEQGNNGEVQDFLNSLQGTAGLDGKTAEFRCNPLTNALEIRYEGQRLWSQLIQFSTESSSCIQS